MTIDVVGAETRWASCGDALILRGLGRWSDVCAIGGRCESTENVGGGGGYDPCTSRSRD